ITRAQMRAIWGACQLVPGSPFLDESPASLQGVASAGSTLSAAAFAASGGYGGVGYSGAGGGGRRGPSYRRGVGGGRQDVHRPSFWSGRKPVSASQMPQLAVGDRVTHDSFGIGTVSEVAGQGEKTQVEVAFKAPHGTKRLLLRYAPLTKL